MTTNFVGETRTFVNPTMPQNNLRRHWGFPESQRVQAFAVEEVILNGEDTPGNAVVTIRGDVLMHALTALRHWRMQNGQSPVYEFTLDISSDDFRAIGAALINYPFQNDALRTLANVLFKLDHANNGNCDPSNLNGIADEVFAADGTLLFSGRKPMANDVNVDTDDATE